MYIQKITPADDDICHECRCVYGINNTYKIIPTYTKLNKHTIICKNCLFKLYLELDNIFPYSTLMNGHDQEILNHEYQRLGIPRDVYEYMKEGFRVKAIKALRDSAPMVEVEERDHMGNINVWERSSLSLVDAKHQVEEWSELLFGKKWRQHYYDKYEQSKHRS